MSEGGKSRRMRTYTCNPELFDHDVADGYQDWNMRHLDLGDSNGIWLGCWEDVPAGFLSWTIEEATGVIDLNGVLEAFNGRGIYSRLLLHTLTSFRQQGVRLARIATQLANRRVQQVWERWGFEFTSSQLTFHLNSR